MKFLIFLGTVRDSSPPNPPRLGLRVARACVTQMHQGDISAELINPLDFDLGPIFKPHFAYAQGKAPTQLQTLADKIAAADGYVMVSPEYNHSLSPALAHLLNHFGSSLFSYKPSAIVTYSAGQWGGIRAAVGMRSFLSELGCLPVSAMIHVPRRHMKCLPRTEAFSHPSMRKDGRTILPDPSRNSPGGHPPPKISGTKSTRTSWCQHSKEIRGKEMLPKGNPNNPSLSFRTQ